MTRGPHTIDFCGIKLVRWGYRSRRAVRVHKGTYSVALCPNGSVAVDMDSAFERRRDSKPYTNRRLAIDLRDLKAISTEQFSAHVSLCDSADSAKECQTARYEIENAAEILGITFTKEQRKIIRQKS